MFFEDDYNYSYALKFAKIKAFIKCLLEKLNLGPLTGAIFETGGYGVPSKSQKPFLCGGMRQTITLKSPGKGAPPSTPSWGLK